MTKTYYDIGVIIPLEQELIAFFEVFPSKENKSTADTFIHEVESPTEGIRIVVIHANGMGNEEAGHAARTLASRFSVGLFVCIGIAGSLSDDLGLGDVCYTGRVLNVLENNKVKDGPDDEGVQIEISPNPYETRDTITRAINYSRTQPDMKSAYVEWQQGQKLFVQSHLTSPVPGRFGQKEDMAQPSSLDGAIVCGMVSGSTGYNKKLKAAERKVLAIETESGAIFAEAKRLRIPALTIRGISDYANKDKGKLEGDSKGKVRDIAASNAVSFFQLQLSNHYFLSQIHRNKPGTQQNLDFDGQSEAADKTEDHVDQLAILIEDNLKELSPEHRLQPSGFRVPAPRISKQDPYRDGLTTSYHVPCEIEKALIADKRIMLAIPRSFPDSSLPWLLAHDLIDAELDGKQVIPLVIDASRISGSRGFEKLSDIELSKFICKDGIEVVFVIENVPFSSAGRMTLLRNEVEKYEHNRFIFLSNNTPNILHESDFKIDLGLSIFRICDVSFSEIAIFLQRTFQFDGMQSEVVAKRLWDTFAAFDLSAHPTYFAGIPKETLMSLLQANKRAELLQLAVDGFLVVLVAGDKQDIALSRTTRSRFLSDTLVELEIEKRVLTKADLVRAADDFAKKQDFDIDTLAFIKDFEDKGIIHFEDEKLVFSLPFIERYLLAKRLSEDANLANRYFDFDTLNFDFQIFDLYCEIRPENSIKSKIAEKLSESKQEMSERRNGEYILLGNTLTPKIMTALDRVEALQKRLLEALDDVRSGKPNASEKQKVLDVQERIQSSTAKMAKEDQESNSELDEVLDRALGTFLLGTLLLGSGAEHLVAGEKRQLVLLLVSLGTDIIDVWTKRRAEIDFKEMRSVLTSDEAIADLVQRTNGSASFDDLKGLIEVLVDMMEGALLIEPLRRTLSLLCEQARSNVLAQSIRNTEVSGEFEALLHAAWLTDVSPQEGKERLKSAGKNLGSVAFLRSSLAMHCLSRTFWSHWKKADRLALLDLASDFLKPINGGLDRGKLRRQIEKSADKD